jgi:DNA-binding transcriptional LysR family regulator
MMIRTEALRVFATVAEFGNIRDAADRLFRTQSAISMTLKQLEDQLGAPLFESDRKNNLTDLGRYVQSVAAGLLRDHDAGIGLIEGYAKGRTGRLRIASVPSVAALLIPQVLRDYILARPMAEVDLVDTDSSDVRQLVKTGQADIGIASTSGPDDMLIHEPLFEDQLKVICRADSKIAQQTAPLAWQDLQGVDLILNETTGQITAPAFKALALHAKLRVRNVTSLVAMVGAGVGVAFLPGLATLALPPEIMALALGDIGCKRQVGLLRRAGREQSPLAQAFRQHLITSIAALAPQFSLQLLLHNQTGDPQGGLP